MQSYHTSRFMQQDKILKKSAHIALNNVVKAQQ